MQTVIITGNCGGDPQVKEFQNGGKIASFSVGVTERGFTTKEGKEIPEHTEWFRCETRTSAGYAQSYLHKGDLVEVRGKIRTEEYEVNGEKKSSIKLMVEDMKIYNKK